MAGYATSRDTTRLDSVLYLKCSQACSLAAKLCSSDEQELVLYSSMSMAVFSSPRESSPSRLHSASVHITDVADVSNPHPQGSTSGSYRTSYMSSGTEEDGRSAMAQDYLTPMKLVQLSEEPDLSQVIFLELSVNTTENSLGNFGLYLPNLAELRFTDSVVPCVRDLGTSLPVVSILWMCRCTLKDLDGLSALPCLRELYLAFNNVEDISVITMLSSLEVLDLECNNLSEKDQLGYLGLCHCLTSLTLEGNPLSISLAEDTGSKSGYRTVIHEAVPNLKILDDEVLVEEERDREEVDEGIKEVADNLGAPFLLSDGVLRKDWQILQHSIKEGVQWQQDVPVNMIRPSTAPPLPRRSLSTSPTPPTLTSGDESSELTHGLNQVICGNPVRALRARRQHGLRSQSAMGSRCQPATTTPTSSHRVQDWSLE